MIGDSEKRQDDLLAYLEGRLDPEETARVRRLIETSDEWRADFETLQELVSDLEALGDSMDAKAPEVDLVDAVMRDVRRAGQPRLKTLEGGRPVRRRRALWATVAVAAVHLLVFGLIWYLRSSGPEDLGPLIARPEHEQPALVESPDQPVTAALQPELDKLEELKERLDQIEPMRIVTAELEGTAPPALADLSVGDILEARRNTASEGGGWEQLLQWAALAPGDAEAIVSDPESSPALLVAAAQALDPSAAEQALLTAVGHLPEDPYVHFALLKVRTAEPTAEPKAETQAGIQVLRDLDPENALSYYIEARLLLDSGDVAGALEALAEARELEEASPYSLESALYREGALVENGLGTDAAHVLSALTAGVDEYSFLTELGNDLLAYGQAMMDANDIGSAQEIFEAVQELGTQLETGATMQQEALAGLDIQQSANEFLEGLYTAIESVEGINMLAVQTAELIVGLEGIRDFFTALDQLFMGEEEPGFFSFVADVILLEGDVPVFDRLLQMGFGWLGPLTGAEAADAATVGETAS